MARQRLLLLLILLVAAVPVCAHPEPPASGSLPLFSAGSWRRLGAARPDFTPGAWVAYRLTTPDAPPSTLRIAMVPASPPAEMAVELRHQPAEGPAVWMKFGLGPEEDGRRPLVALLVQVPGMPPLPLPVAEATAEGTGPLGSWDPHAGGTTEGEETLDTPLGRRRVRRVRTRAVQADQPSPVLWLDRSGEVPVFGLVRGRQGEERMELTGFGRDARPELPDFEPGARPTPATDP